MPPRKTRVAEEGPAKGPVTRGAGVTTGLELWRIGKKFVLVDTSPEQRFTTDIGVWNAGLNDAQRKLLKDAVSQCK